MIADSCQQFCSQLSAVLLSAVSSSALNCQHVNPQEYSMISYYWSLHSFDLFSLNFWMVGINFLTLHLEESESGNLDSL